MKIFLVRHGQSEANAKGIHQGQRVDSPLSKKGRSQAKKIADRLKNEKIDAIYSSDFKRARETAEIIAKGHNVSVRLDKRLREFNMGDFTRVKDNWRLFQEHKDRESKKRGIKQYKIEAINGESEWAHILRVRSFLKGLLKEKHKNVIIVAHGGTNKIFFGLINHVSKSDMYSIGQHNCCLNEFEFDGKKWIVHRINCIKHLEKC